MGLFSSLSAAVKVGIEASGAVSAATEAYQEGRSLPQIVEAFSSRTSNDFDDAMASELLGWMSGLVEGAERVAGIAQHAAVVASEAAPQIAGGLQSAIDTIEFHAPNVLHALHQVAQRTESASDAAQRAALIVADQSERLAAVCRSLMEDG